MPRRRGIDELLAAAEAQGWRVEVRRGGHLCFISPSGAKVFTSSTPSDPRAWLNARAVLRRHGLAV